MKRFSEFAEDTVLDGNKKRIDDILNKEIIILNYRIKTSRYSEHKDGKYLTLQIEIENEKFVIFTGSEVLIEQIERYASELPFVAIIRKINKYYTLT
jgi:hypothetical protein